MIVDLRKLQDWEHAYLYINSAVMDKSTDFMFLSVYITENSTLWQDHRVHPPEMLLPKETYT